MIGAKQRYLELMTHLLLRRELAPGALPPEEEARFAAGLDTCWQALTDEEQEDLERHLAQALPEAPEHLHEVDQRVSEGEQVAPRKAA